MFPWLRLILKNRVIETSGDSLAFCNLNQKIFFKVEFLSDGKVHETEEHVGNAASSTFNVPSLLMKEPDAQK